MRVLDLLAADETTVLFSFDNPTGVVNPNAVRTNLMADLDVGTIQDEISIFRTAAAGGLRIGGPKLPPVEMRFGAVLGLQSSAESRPGLGSWPASPSVPWDRVGSRGRERRIESLREGRQDRSHPHDPSPTTGTSYRSVGLE